MVWKGFDLGLVVVDLVDWCVVVVVEEFVWVDYVVVFLYFEVYVGVG